MEGIASLASSLGEEAEQGLAMFNKPVTANIYESSNYVTIKPIHSLSESGPYRFEIGGDDT